MFECRFYPDKLLAPTHVEVPTRVAEKLHPRSLGDGVEVVEDVDGVGRKQWRQQSVDGQERVNVP